LEKLPNQKINKRKTAEISRTTTGKNPNSKRIKKKMKEKKNPLSLLQVIIKIWG